MPKQNQPDGLISVLLDEKAEFGDRDDAALDLAAYDEPAAEGALLTIALGKDADLADSAGHSIWEIWQRKRKHDGDIVARMHPEARKFFQK
jgi:hypothetical protein